MSGVRCPGWTLGLALGLLTGCSLTLAAPPPAGEIPFRTRPEPTPTPTRPSVEARPLPQPVATVTIAGEVLNGTLQAPASGVTVTLYALIDASPVFSQTVRTRVDGTFRLEGVPVYPGAVYLPTAEWQGVVYPAAHPLTLTAGSAPTVSLTVFERAADPSAIHVDQVHWILQPLGDRLLVTEVWVYSNRGTTTYGGADQPGLVFLLPPDAANLRISGEEMGARYRLEGDQLIDTAPIPPGAGYQSAFGYELPLARVRTLRLRSIYPVARWSLLIAGGALEAAGLGVRDLGTRPLGNTVYRLYDVVPPPPGGTTEVALRPRSAGPRWLPLAGILSGAGLAIGLLALRRRMQS